MSAYIVNPTHIDVIISYFITSARHDGLWCRVDGQNYDYMTPHNAANVAEILWRQNVRSVDVRYNEENDSRYSFKFIHQASRVYTIAEIGMALAGLEYQSCETDDYRETDAYKILTDMRKHLLGMLADRESANTWEIGIVRSQFAASVD